MTPPVVQESEHDQGRHVVGFVMPTEFTAETLPTPTDPRIRIREVPTQVAAVRAFTRRWSERIYQQPLAELRTAAQKAGLTIIGPPRFARFDPPWTPWSCVTTRSCCRCPATPNPSLDR